MSCTEEQRRSAWQRHEIDRQRYYAHKALLSTLPCDHCLTNAAACGPFRTPDARRVYFCDHCRERNQISELIADVCQRAAPLIEHAQR